jgi:hypothetical protein
MGTPSKAVATGSVMMPPMVADHGRQLSSVGAAGKSPTLVGSSLAYTGRRPGVAEWHTLPIQNRLPARA